MSDKMFYPCNPSLSMVSDTYQGHAARDGYTGWAGYDIASYGSVNISLYSVISGTCVEAKFGDNGLGNYVIIENDEYRFVFGHLTQYLCSVGDEITAGDMIGTMGTSGNSTGVHVHWSMWEYNLLADTWDIIDVGSEWLTFYNPVSQNTIVNLMSDGRVVVEDQSTEDQSTPVTVPVDDGYNATVMATWGAALRSAPSISDTTLVGYMAEGTRLLATDEVVDADGYTWRKLEMYMAEVDAEGTELLRLDDGV